MTRRHECLIVMVLGAMASAALAQNQGKAAQSPEAELERQYAPNHPAVLAAKQARVVEDELRAELAAAGQNLRVIRAKMREVNGGRPVEGLRETTSLLQRDATRLRIDMAGMNARREVVAKAIDEGRKSAAEQSERDPVAAQLKEVIRLLEDSAKQTKEAFNAGATTPTEMRRAEVDLAGAKVKLLERQQAVAQQSGGADVARLAEQLRDLSASVVETRARLEATDEVLATHERVQEILEQEEAARRQIDKLRGMIEHVEKVKLDRRLGVPGEAAGNR